jgi:endonuclease/exonuclease/phosphatase family metal-dependent hydrolase
VETSGVVESNYMHNAQVPVGGSSVTFTRGYTKVEASVDGAKFTFVNSHLEGLMPANEDQAHEMVGILQGYSQPLIFVGDLNTGPGSSTPAYSIFSGAGFTDAWTQASSDPGFTCCYGEKVNDTDTSALDERIDLMFYAGSKIQPLSGQIVGNQLADRTASGLWPSDHAGTVITFRIQR